MSHIPSARGCFRALLIAIGTLLLIRDWRAESSPPDDTLDRHLTQLGVIAWHNQGVQGEGIRIAILDSGFRGYRSCLGSTLPADVKVKSFRHDANFEARNSTHGIACAETTHALAPRAELMFVNWEPDDAESFLAAARWCREQGAHIVSCSVVIPAWSDGEGGGAVHRELARIFGNGDKPGDILGVAAAGNLATRHWGGRFRDDGRGCHLWRAGRIDNELKPWGSECVSVELQARPRARFSLQVLDVATGQSIAEPQTHGGPDRFTQSIRFLPRTGGSYAVRVSSVEPHTGEPFHLVALGASLEHVSSSGSIVFPGDGGEWLTVGAVESDGTRAWYSSCGPNSRLPKPDLTALVPFPLSRRGRPLGGTSAAPPQAAALAALIWSRHPGWTSARVRESLCRAAIDIGPPGHDLETGLGRLALPSIREAESP
jgi:Subtilase family